MSFNMWKSGVIWILLCWIVILSSAVFNTVQGVELKNEETEEQDTCNLETSFKCDLDSDHSECFDQLVICNGISECQNGRDESVEICGCLPNEYECNNTHCIDLIKRCNTFEDCEDGNDEENCETYLCPDSFYKCDNHFCIPREKECNFVDDCGDNSDEKRCKRRSCFTTEFQCNNKECVPMSYVCDNQVDCVDGSDEDQENCEEHYRCPNGLYVHKKRVCDNWNDCYFTHQDETNCGDCKPDEYKCFNKQCIGQANHCDGVCDCIYCEDEHNCSTASDSCSLGNRYMCKKKHRCINQRFLCDGHNDCKNTNIGADEFFCSADISDGCEKFKDVVDPFVCREGRCLPGHVRCDYYADCLNGEDEENCNFASCSGNEFECDNKQCIPSDARCDGHMDCFDRSDEAKCSNYSCAVGYKKCKSGQCISTNYWCDHWYDCPDHSDELSCVLQPCHLDEFRCTTGQCIPIENHCYGGKTKGRQVCSDNSHLINCSKQVCGKEEFKCRNSYCIDKQQECDGVIDCQMTYWDEHNCPYSCPYKNDECICVDMEMNCENRNFTELPSLIEETLTKFRLSGNDLNASISEDTFHSFHRLTYLDLSNNNLHFLPKSCFSSLWRLATLNLKNNHLTEIRNETFIGLSNLRQLYLSGNQIHYIHPDSFVGLSHLRSLDLSNQNIHSLPQNAFAGLRNVFNLNLSNNHIEYINDGAFNGLNNLYLLDISRNDISIIEQHVFHGIPKLRTLHTDEFRFCCLAKNVDQCFPEPNEFSSCQDLMSNYVLRIAIWILGMVAAFGNLLVIGWRARDLRGGKVHSFLITNLAIGDFFMGVYLLIVAVVDSYYRGVYIVHDLAWRQSNLCRFAGFISTFSSELSVFTLTVITLDRLICILFPLRMRRLSLKESVFVMGFVWTVVFVLSVLPLAGLDYFTDFYGRSGVCLAFHITASKPPGWEYSVALFLALNFASFLVIFLSYFWMFIVAKRTRRAVRATETKTDAAMARRMTLIVMTDFFCWVPIILLGYASLGGASIPPEVYAWVAVFVLPLNSAINPVLYTISTAPFLGNMRTRAYRFRKSFMNSFTQETKHTFMDERTSNTWDRKSPYRHMDLIKMKTIDKSPVHSQSDQSDF